MAELSSSDRDSIACKAQNIYHLASKKKNKKVCQALVWSNQGKQNVWSHHHLFIHSFNYVLSPHCGWGPSPKHLGGAALFLLRRSVTGYLESGALQADSQIASLWHLWRKLPTGGESPSHINSSCIFHSSVVFLWDCSGQQVSSKGYWECFPEAGWGLEWELLSKEQFCLGGLPLNLLRAEIRAMECEVLRASAVWAGKTLRDQQPIVQKRNKPQMRINLHRARLECAPYFLGLWFPYSLFTK